MTCQLVKRAGLAKAAWELANGPVPNGAYVLHRCDEPRCVNTDHLFLGDASANFTDMILKGRGDSRIQTANAVRLARIRADKYYPTLNLGSRPEAA